MPLSFWLPRLNAGEKGFPAFIVFIGIMLSKLKAARPPELPHKECYPRDSLLGIVDS
jgi:hypothetical protein